MTATLTEQQFAEYVERAESDLRHWKTRVEVAERERNELRVALDDLMSWFPEKPEWRLTAGEHGADDAVAAARAALEGKT